MKMNTKLFEKQIELKDSQINGGQSDGYTYKACNTATSTGPKCVDNQFSLTKDGATMPYHTSYQSVCD